MEEGKPNSEERKGEKRRGMGAKRTNLPGLKLLRSTRARRVQEGNRSFQALYCKPEAEIAALCMESQTCSLTSGTNEGQGQAGSRTMLHSPSAAHKHVPCQ